MILPFSTSFPLTAREILNNLSIVCTLAVSLPNNWVLLDKFIHNVIPHPFTSGLDTSNRFALSSVTAALVYYKNVIRIIMIFTSIYKKSNRKIKRVCRWCQSNYKKTRGNRTVLQNNLQVWSNFRIENA